MSRFMLFAACFCFIFTMNARAQTWSMQETPAGTSILGKVQFVSATEGWISEGNGTLLHTTDMGAHWNTVTITTSDTVELLSDPAVAMSFVNASTGWAIGTLGGLQNPGGAVLYKTADGGKTWSRKPLAPWTVGFSVQFVDDKNGWVTVFDGTFPEGVPHITAGAVLRTTDGGDTWMATSDKVGTPFFVDANTGWMVSSGLSATGEIVPPFEILHTTDGGINWTSQIRDDSLSDTRIHFTDANHGWVVSGERILRTANGGTTWESVTNSGAQLSGDTRNTVFFRNAEEGWIGSHYHPDGQVNSSVVLHTTDGGDTWSKQNAPDPDMDKIFSMYFTDTNTGWIVFDCGAVWHAGGTVTAVDENAGMEAPGRFVLNQNYPNPFNPRTTISFSLPSRSVVSLRVFDILGREIETLASGEFPAGEHAVEWNAENAASGIYFYRLRVGNAEETRKLTLLR